MVISASALSAHALWLARGSSGDGARLTVRGEDARGQDLRSVQLSGAVIERCNLEGALLGGTAWASAQVSGSSLRDAVLGDATLDDASFVDCDFRDADFSVLGSAVTGWRGTTARCRFERCDLRGSVWLDRDVSGARFIDCRFDVMGGAPREAADVEIERPRLSSAAGAGGADDADRIAAAAEILAQWQVGKPRPPLGDEDKAFVHRGLLGRWRKREAHLARGPRAAPATGVGSIADKWSEPFLPDVGGTAPAAGDAGEPIALPTGTAAGVTARRGANGVVIYRDPRSGFALALPSPVFLAPSPDMDATVGVAGAVLHICRTPAGSGAGLADEVAGLVRDLAGIAPETLDLAGNGVTAAAVATARRSELVREVAAIAGGHGSGAAVMLLLLDYGTGDVDAVTALTVWSAILSSAAFGPGRSTPELVPSSPWWEPGLPARLAASRPSLPPIAGARDVALGLLALTELLPPTQRLDGVVRSEVARRLAAAGAGDAPRLAQTLATIHDLRGLAVALAGP